jgi:hypothetical protein
LSARKLEQIGAGSQYINLVHEPVPARLPARRAGIAQLWRAFCFIVVRRRQSIAARTINKQFSSKEALWKH